MTNSDFDKIFEMAEAKTGHPIFRHRKYGVLIAGDGEYAGEKEPCEDCAKMIGEYGQSQDCYCKQDIRFVGLWTPVDWGGEPTYAIRDENTTPEMENDETWSILNISDLEFTGKFRRN